MTPGALLLELRAAGAVLRVVGGRLEAKHIPPALAPLARAHAAELRGLLAPPAHVEQLPAAPPAPTPPGAPEVSSDDTPRGALDLAGAEHLPAGAPVPNVPTIAKINPAEAPRAQLDGPEAPRADRLPRRAPPGYPLRAAAGAQLDRPPPPLASPEAVARAIDGTLGALPAVLAPWQRFELGAWGADRRDRWAREVAEGAAAEVLAYYRTRPGGPTASGVALRSVANPSADPFEGPEHDPLAPVDGPEAPPEAPPRRMPPPWRWSDVVPMAPEAPRSDRGDPFPHPLDAPPSPRTAPATPAAPDAAPAAAPEGGAVESREARAARHGLVILPSGAYVDADQAEELPRPPALARFDVRTDPGTDPEEHRRQALRADVAAYMASWTPTGALRSPHSPRTCPARHLRGPPLPCRTPGAWRRWGTCRPRRPATRLRPPQTAAPNDATMPRMATIKGWCAW